MTQVDFHFITPTGEPIQEGFVEITLSESAWLEIESGVVIPRIVFGYTDNEGRISFDLWPVDTAEYTVTVTDTHKDNEVVTKHYFYVPRSDVPVRLQDILMDPPPTPKPYDEASIEAIQENRILAQYAQEQTQGLHDTVVDLEAIVVQHQADVAVKHQQVESLYDSTVILRDESELAMNRAHVAQQGAEAAQLEAEAALSAAISEALRAEAARTGSETARADAQAFRLQALGFKDQAEAAAATAESIVVTHEAKANPHAQYLLSNDAVATYETLVNATAKLNQALAHTDAHTARIDNPHGVTKDQVGLGLVDNVSAANLRDRGSHTGYQGIDTITGLEAILVDKLGSAHSVSGDHDNRYYTKDEVNNRYPIPAKNNYSGVRAPLETDDETLGYAEGSVWFDASTGLSYRCTVATSGSANWIQTSLEASALGSAALEDVVFLVDRTNHTGTQALATISDAGTAAAENVEAFEAAGSIAAHVAEQDPHTQYVQKEAGKGLSEAEFTQAEKDKLASISDGATGSMTGAEIKSAYEAEQDTNAYTDAEKSKLLGIEAGATANSNDIALLSRVNHTGSQTLATISDAGTAAGADVGDFEASGSVAAHKAETAAHDAANITYDQTTVWEALSSMEAQMGDVATILADINGSA